jgi:branched-chain amino acid transport system substrate-binding protein
MRWLTSQNVGLIAIVAAADTFPHASAIAMAKAAPDAGIPVTDEETVDKGTNDFGAILDRLKAGTPDQVVTILGPFTAGFFKAYEASGWKVPLTGRIDFLAALAAFSRQFTDSGSLSRMTSITVFTPEQQTAVLQSQNLQRVWHGCGHRVHGRPSFQSNSFAAKGKALAGNSGNENAAEGQRRFSI